MIACAANQIPINVFQHLLIDKPQHFVSNVGSSVADILRTTGYLFVLKPEYHCIITIESSYKSTLVPKDRVEEFKPCLGEKVNVRIIPTGGSSSGKNPLASVLMIATMAMGAVFAPMIATSVMGMSATAAAAAGGMTAFGFAAISMVAGMGISLLGSMIISAIAPPQQTSLGTTTTSDDKTIYSISGVQNRINPYGIIPFMVGGEDKVYPIMGAAQFTEVSGDDEYLRLRFIMMGKNITVDPATFKIGDTLLTDYDEVEIDYCLDSDIVADRPTLYANNQDIHQEVLSIDLTDDVGTVTRTTQPNTTEISYDIGLTRGLFRINSTTGDKSASTVQFKETIKLTSTLAVVSTRTITITGLYTTLTRFNYRRAVTEGTYTIEWERITADDSTGYLYNQTSIVALRSISDHPGLIYDKLPALAVFDIRIKATGQLNGTVDSFNFIAKAKLPVWNTTTGAFVYTLSNNPAWAFVNLLMGIQRTPIRRITSPDRFDIPKLLEWAALCTAQGWKINGLIDSQQTLFDSLRNVASVGRGSLSMVRGRYSVAYDWYKSDLVQVFTPRNSWGFEAAKVFAKKIEGVDVTFKSKAESYQDTTIRVYNDEYDSSTAEQIDKLSLLYVDNETQAYKQARFHMADAQLRPEVFTFNTDIENIVCKRGDRIRLVSDVIMVGLGQAYITELDKDASDNVISIGIDSKFTMSPDITYGINVRTFDGAVVEGNLVSPVETEVSSILYLSSPIPASAGLEGGELLIFGEADKGVGYDCIITKIEASADLCATISARAYAPEVFVADTQTIPAFDPQLQYPAVITIAVPEAPTIVKVVSDETVMITNIDGTLKTRALVTVELPSGVIPISQIRLDYRRVGNDKWQDSVINPSDNKTIVLTELLDGEFYDFRVASVSKYGIMSLWSTMSYVFIEGKTNPPPNVGDVVVDGKMIRWEYPDKPADFAGYKVRYGSSSDWNIGTPAHEGLLTDATFRIDNVAGARLYMIKAVDKVGLESIGYSYITAELIEFGSVEAAETENQAPTFSGVKDSCSISDGMLVSDPTDEFWAGDTLSFWRGPSELFWPGGLYKPCRYGFKPTVVSMNGVHSIDVDANSAPVIQYRAYTGSIDLDATTGWFPWSGSVGISGPIYFRLTWNVASYQVIVTDVKWLFAAPTVEETLYNIRIEALTGTVLPITKTYDLIKSVNILALYYGTNGAVPVIENKSATGPLVSIVNAAGTKVSGYVDVTIRGFKE